MGRDALMNSYEYEFMTGQWKGVKGAAYNAVFTFCNKQGWVMGLSDHGEPTPTDKGLKAITKYKERRL